MKTIAYICDIHLDEDFPATLGVDAHNNWKHIMEDIRQRNIKDIIFGGDIGEIASNESFFDSLKDFNLHITPGNHDDGSEILKYYPGNQNSGSEIYHSEEDEFFKYIFLDSSKEELSDNQFDWLKNELKSNKNILLFIHHPILEVDSPIDKKYPLHGREKISALLKDYNNHIHIFCGHYHMQDEKSIGNIRQYITPAASYQIKKHADKIETESDTFGYRLIKIDKQQMETQVIFRKNGKFIPVQTERLK